jgi:putative membrane protein
MKTTITQITIAFFAFATFSCKKEQVNQQNALQSKNASSAVKQDSLNSEDTDYLVSSAEGSRLEVVLGGMAQTHAKDINVKEFGLKMVQDHSLEHKQVMNMADSKNFDVPDHPSKDQQEEIEELSHYYGDKFDKEYISYEVWDHKQDIKDANGEIQDGNDADVKNMARVWLPILVGHLEYAEWVAKKVHAPLYHNDN